MAQYRKLASWGRRAGVVAQALADRDQDMKTVSSAYTIPSALTGLQRARPLQIRSLDPGAQGSLSLTQTFLS